MAGMERMKLTDAAIARLRPREREYTVWDSRVVSLGVRVRPTGGRSYVLLLYNGGRTKRVSLSPVGVKSLEEVRRECQARQAKPEPEEKTGPARPVPLFRDFVAGPWKEAHFDGYKPSTKKGVRHQLAAQLLPAFGAKPLDRIWEAGIRRWFDCYSRTAPGNANHALARLRQILNFAIACGYIENNPRGQHRIQPAPATDALPVAGGTGPSPCRARLACRPEARQTAGRHHPPPAVHRLPQERDYGPRLVGSAR